MKSPLIILVIALVLAGCQSQKPSSPSQDTFAFGIISDIQYADKDPDGPRHYRTSLPRLEACIEELNQHDLAFTIQLGDIIDGNETHAQTVADLSRVLKTYYRLDMPLYHVVGNHCLYAGKVPLGLALGLIRFYYDFTVPEAPGWRFIVLNGNDAGYGMLGEAQLEWLEERLVQADARGEQVLLFNHFAALREAAPHGSLQHPQELLQLIDKHACVVASFAGHDHSGGYAYTNGVHHITLRGMVEAPESNAYGIIKVSPEKLQEIGFGKEPDRDLLIRRP